MGGVSLIDGCVLKGAGPGVRLVGGAQLVNLQVL